MSSTILKSIYMKRKIKCGLESAYLVWISIVSLSSLARNDYLIVFFAMLWLPRSDYIGDQVYLYTKKLKSLHGEEIVLLVEKNGLAWLVCYAMILVSCILVVKNIGDGLPFAQKKVHALRIKSIERPCVQNAY